MRRAVVLCLAAITLAGCAPAARVVLQSDADGKTGRIEVKTNTGTQILQKPDMVTEIASATATPTAPRPISRQEIDETWGQALAVRPPPPQIYSLYFHSGGSELTDESRALLSSIRKTVSEWRYPWIAISGHADATGSVELNDRIARQRAEAVRDELRTMGVAADSMVVESHGKGNPLIPTPDGVAEPRNRRVSVTIR